MNGTPTDHWLCRKCRAPHEATAASFPPEETRTDSLGAGGGGGVPSSCYSALKLIGFLRIYLCNLTVI